MASDYGSRVTLRPLLEPTLSDPVDRGRERGPRTPGYARRSQHVVAVRPASLNGGAGANATDPRDSGHMRHVRDDLCGLVLDDHSLGSSLAQTVVHADRFTAVAAVAVLGFVGAAKWVLELSPFARKQEDSAHPLATVLPLVAMLLVTLIPDDARRREFGLGSIDPVLSSRRIVDALEDGASLPGAPAFDLSTRRWLATTDGGADAPSYPADPAGPAAHDASRRLSSSRPACRHGRGGTVRSNVVLHQHER